MPYTLYESGGKREKKAKKSYSITAGQMTSNLDCINQGKVLIRIPSLDQEVWARLSAPGAGAGAGIFYIPRVDDEVLVALCEEDPNDAYIIGGLWSSKNSPPVSSGIEAIAKRIIKTGLDPVSGIGHEVEFDDGPGQSITITTSTRQKITIDPLKIELSNTAGTLKITLDNKKQSISIDAAVSLELNAVGSIKMKAASIEIGDLTRTAMVSIKGGQVMIN